MSETVKKIGAIGCILIFALSVFIGWYGDTQSIRYEAPAASVSVLPEEKQYVSGYAIDGNSYVPNQDDPQLGFLLAPRPLQTVIVRFAQPLHTLTLLQVFYA